VKTIDLTKFTRPRSDLYSAFKSRIAERIRAFGLISAETLTPIEGSRTNPAAAERFEELMRTHEITLMGDFCPQSNVDIYSTSLHRDVLKLRCGASSYKNWESTLPENNLIGAFFGMERVNIGSYAVNPEGK
jgi:hypothetical protein